jgi:alkylation response protein AidB-like acyl-CoA dehydrogenase
MKLKMSAELEAFRSEVRAWIQANLPQSIAQRIKRVGNPTPDEDGMEWLGILARKGWSVPHWPVEYGGTGWSPWQLFVFEEECHRADAPVPAWQGTHMCGPVIYTFGTQAQKDRFLPPMSNGTHLWAQGFSEPGAGSDLASLRTSARRDGDHYVINGQKIWTSGAYHANWGFFLVRTNPDAKPQAGISFLLVDMQTPGITVRRIMQSSGDAHLCEVFLDNVRVPAENLVGEENKGWSYAKFLLDHERTASSFIYWSKRELEKTRELAQWQHDGDVPLIALPEFRDRLARLEAELLALEWSVLRVLADEKFPHPATAVASSLKVRGSEIQQRLTGLQMDVLGRLSARAWPYEQILTGEGHFDAVWPDYVPGKTALHMQTLASTIYGGSLQVQKNIIAKLAFEL